MLLYTTRLAVEESGCHSFDEGLAMRDLLGGSPRKLLCAAADPLRTRPPSPLLSPPPPHTVHPPTQPIP
jgi:hypothetical protein